MSKKLGKEGGIRAEPKGGAGNRGLIKNRRQGYGSSRGTDYVDTSSEKPSSGLVDSLPYRS